MKIILLSFYSGIVERGVETLVQALVQRLGPKHQILILQSGPVTQTDNCRQIKVPYSGILTITQPEKLFRKLFLDLQSLKILFFTIKTMPVIHSQHPDVIIPLNGGWQSLLIKLYSIIFKSKMVITGQAGLGWDEKWNLLLRPSLYVAISKRNYHWAKKLYPQQKYAIIFNGVDLDKFSSAPSSPIKKSLHQQIDHLPKPLILCVAGPETYKRVHCTINAVARLPSTGLLVVGGSQATNKLGSKLLGNSYMQLKIAHQDMPSIYSRADIFTLVSEPTEAFGIAYIEAMACNLAVVAPNDSLRKELIGPAGIYVNHPQDSLQYSQKLQQALKKNWGNIPRKQATKFNWNKIAVQYEQEIMQLQQIVI